MFAIRPQQSTVVVIDVQERFIASIPSIAAGEPVGRRLKQLLSGAATLGAELIISEQVPDKLGPTLQHLRAVAGDAQVYCKRDFSAAADPVIAAALGRNPGNAVILAGIEAHICVLATAADLRASGRTVIICGDAVAARDPGHAELARQAARDLGCLVLPVESVLFRWLGSAGSAHFKAISALVR